MVLIMKKISLLIGAALFSSVLFAQQPKIGIKAGANFSNLVADNDYGSSREYRVGFNGGLLAHIHTNNRSIAVQPEIVFSSQGSKFSDQEIVLNYVNVPILLQYMFDNGFRLEAGPQVGVLTSAKAKANGIKENIKNEYKDGDFSWAFGLGYLSYSGLGVNARYNLGVSNVSNIPGDAKTRNSVFQVGLFYLLDHSHKAKSK